ncbi:NDMA-dependent alcohol dehydrogenase [Klenkia sp. LSe6-5]|uniref:NDMA-dependent alcohol dehydrogenase n=1 Tax=Klenkia sesuvii TaxID=3103137 RepID=A0ABU8DYB4_9ACTN
MPTTTRASIIRQSPGEYETVTLELDDPKKGEVQVKMAASGLCHSDDHLQTGDLQVMTYPFCGGHEGSGVITKVGPDTPGFEEGDHVVFSFVPSCGQCSACRRGDFNLCDKGALLLVGSRADDAEDFRMKLDGQNVGQMCGISTFSEYTTADVASVIKIDKDIPLKSAALVGCGVPTGFGTAVKAGGVKPGDVVIVMGIGGIGINAVQGAAHAGATRVIAVDPTPFKREMAQEFGATDVFENMEQATEFAQSITEGQGADVALVTVGVLEADHPAQALASIRKGGTVVVTGLGKMTELTPISAFDLTLMQKRLQGAIIGAQSPHSDIPKLLRMYQAGQLKLDELITKEYTLDQVTEAYKDMHEGKNIRGVIVFD